jgi:hypothetical protein
MNCKEVCLLCESPQKYKINFSTFHGVCENHRTSEIMIEKCIMCESAVPILAYIPIIRCVTCKKDLTKFGKSIEAGNKICKSCLNNTNTESLEPPKVSKEIDQSVLSTPSNTIDPNFHNKDGNNTNPKEETTQVTRDGPKVTSECSYCCLTRECDLLPCSHNICGECYNEQCPYCKDEIDLQKKKDDELKAKNAVSTASGILKEDKKDPETSDKNKEIKDTLIDHEKKFKDISNEKTKNLDEEEEVKSDIIKSNEDPQNIIMAHKSKANSHSSIDHEQNKPDKINSQNTEGIEPSGKMTDTFGEGKYSQNRPNSNEEKKKDSKEYDENPRKKSNPSYSIPKELQRITDKPQSKLHHKTSKQCYCILI